VKTGREKIYDLISRLRKSADIDYDLGIQLLDKASEELAYAEKLSDLMPSLTDEACDRIVQGWPSDDN
jgi:hypothetical protein